MIFISFFVWIVFVYMPESELCSKESMFYLDKDVGTGSTLPESDNDMKCHCRYQSNSLILELLFVAYFHIMLTEPA